MKKYGTEQQKKKHYFAGDLKTVLRDLISV
jgi:hypothetical protein